MRASSYGSMRLPTNIWDRTSFLLVRSSSAACHSIRPRQHSWQSAAKQAHRGTDLRFHLNIKILSSIYFVPSASTVCCPTPFRQARAQAGRGTAAGGGPRFSRVQPPSATLRRRLPTLEPVFRLQRVRNPPELCCDASQTAAENNISRHPQ